MAKLGTIDFTGESGKIYTFNVYPADAEFHSKGGVYFLTERVVQPSGEIKHSKVCLGITDDIHQKFNVDSDKFLAEGKANCICAYWEDHDHLRREIEEDLFKHYHTPIEQEITH